MYYRLCARCWTRLEEEEMVCPFCGADLRRLFAVRRGKKRHSRDEPPVGPPELGDDDEDRGLPPPPYMRRGLVAGAISGLVLGVPAGFVGFLAAPWVGDSEVAAAVAFVIVLAGGIGLGLVMAREEDFSYESANWLVYVLMGVYTTGSLVLFMHPYVVFITWAISFVQRILAAYFYHTFWGETWDIG